MHFLCRRSVDLCRPCLLRLLRFKMLLTRFSWLAQQSELANCYIFFYLVEFNWFITDFERSLREDTLKIEIIACAISASS